MQSIIACTGITKTYYSGDEAATVLRDVGFTVEAGEYVAIIGPSGSGKSTLMHILGALDTPTSGTYILNGKDVTSLDEDELARIRREEVGFVFQSFNLLPRASLVRNVELPLAYANVPPALRRARAEQALAGLGIMGRQQLRRPSQISGGQMQRVAIARALVTNPSIILADEPTGNLDQANGALVLEALGRLHKRGKTVLVITHDAAIAAHAPRTIHIQDGVLVSDTTKKPRGVLR